MELGFSCKVGVAGELLVAEQFESYPGYLGSLRPTGSVNVSSKSFGIQLVAFAVSGLDRACATSNLSQANACGIHVHEGSSCQDAGGSETKT